LEQSFEMN